jgi:integrative and conjugative element protein (TIGR02256 family)
MLNFRLGASGQSLTISDGVLEHFSKHRQRKCWSREAGGQLFAEINGVDIVIACATGPRRADRRSRFTYYPDRRLEQIEIDRYFARGFHYVGDWHTHPELRAAPSWEDLRSMRECVRKSRHRLNSFVLVIAGTAEVPDGLHVSLHTGSEVVVLWDEKGMRNGQPRK